MKAGIHNEFIVWRVLRPDGPPVYRIKIGETVISEFATQPTDDQIREALRLHRDKAAIDERQSSR